MATNNSTFNIPASIPVELHNYFAAREFATKQDLVLPTARLKKSELYALLDEWFSADKSDENATEPATVELVSEVTPSLEDQARDAMQSGDLDTANKIADQIVDAHQLSNGRTFKDNNNNHVHLPNPEYLTEVKSYNMPESVEPAAVSTPVKSDKQPATDKQAVKLWVARTAEAIDFATVKNEGTYISIASTLKGVRYYVGQRGGNATVSVWFESKSAKAAFERAAFNLDDLINRTQVEIAREDEGGAYVFRSYGLGLDRDWASNALLNYLVTFESALAAELPKTHEALVAAVKAADEEYHQALAAGDPGRLTAALAATRSTMREYNASKKEQLKATK